MDYKPQGYTSVAPYLVVDGARRTVEFLQAVFDAQPLRMHPMGEGRLGHAEVRIDDTVLMLSDAMDGWPAVASHVHLYVPDVDATWQRAMAAGAEPVQAPVQKDDADRRGGFRDAGGTTWWVSTQVG
ncbi:VOC family protein [Luteimonas aestuarii]|uniref:VOC family protein n=1 Tax=Luteimonas aestuarii TaxID=453837 RepID=A0A4R5TME7_9GAMM|nr:VOC family protein [Luteimonas aestuarii]TDK18563.1 VOC family protein [Luteimonas aestuarii]